MGWRVTSDSMCCKCGFPTRHELPSQQYNWPLRGTVNLRRRAPPEAHGATHGEAPAPTAWQRTNREWPEVERTHIEPQAGADEHTQEKHRVMSVQARLWSRWWVLRPAPALRLQLGLQDPVGFVVGLQRSWQTLVLGKPRPQSFKHEFMGVLLMYPCGSWSTCLHDVLGHLLANVRLLWLKEAGAHAAFRRFSEFSGLLRRLLGFGMPLPGRASDHLLAAARPPNQSGRAASASKTLAVGEGTSSVRFGRHTLPSQILPHGATVHRHRALATPTGVHETIAPNALSANLFLAGVLRRGDETGRPPWP